MKKTIFSLVFLFVFTAISAQWVTDKKYGYKINIPNEWSRESKFDGTDMVYDYMDPTQNIFIEVRTFSVDGNVTPDLLAQAFETQFLSTGTRIAYESYTLNNTPGKFGGYTMNIDGLDVGIGTFYAVKNGIGYVLWSMIETSLYNQYSATGDAVLNSFTTFPPVNNTGSVVGSPVFKITNMRLGKKLTSDHNILPQDESLDFETEQNEIFVIWDWEGKASGKTMTVKWYYNGREISGASQAYQLPNNSMGYGWANLQKPAGGFRSGKYYVQIDFEGKKQKRIDFQINKAASNQNSGFVISPSGSNTRDLNPGGNSSSDFALNWNGFVLGEELKPGSKTEIRNPTREFYPDSPQVISVFSWKGNGSGHTVTVKWKYWSQGASESVLIAETDYQVPAGNGGTSNFSLSRPDAGWPLGQYWVDYSVDGQFFHEIRFDVVQGSSSANSTSGRWEAATGGSSSPGNAKKVVLISGGSQSCYSFKSAKVHADHTNADLILEPWCTEEPGVCGNWVLTGKSSLSQVTSAPTGGYISDMAGFTDCQLIPINNVAVFKLKDGTYAKVLIQKTDFDNNQSQNPPCQHQATLLIEYPAF